MFYIDIIFNFFIVQETEDHHLEDGLRVVISNYLSGWFFIDLMSVLPFDKISLAFTS
jgi:hypothetical protein